MHSTTAPGVSGFDMATDEHNFEVLVAMAPDLNVLAHAIVPLGEQIYLALVETIDRRAAATLQALEALDRFELTLVRYDNTGNEVHRENYCVSLAADHWRRVLHIETYWLYGALFKIER